MESPEDFERTLKKQRRMKLGWGGIVFGATLLVLSLIRTTGEN